MICEGCGRQLSNDPDAYNYGKWTLNDPRFAYCADDKFGFCERKALTAQLSV